VPPVYSGQTLDAKRNAYPAATGPDPAGAATCGATCDMGQARVRKCCGMMALVGYFAFPTYPTYDSF